MKKSFMLFLCLALSFVLCISLVGCSESSDNTENVEQEADIEEVIEEEEVEEEEVEEESDSYAYVEQYLSNFEAIEGNGYTVIVDDSIKDDFTALKDCALYTMKKAYEEYGTMDMGVFGHFENYDNAFAYDSTWEQTIFVYQDNVTPSGWKWKLLSQDYDYIKGE